MSACNISMDVSQNTVAPPSPDPRLHQLGVFRARMNLLNVRNEASDTIDTSFIEWLDTFNGQTALVDTGLAANGPPVSANGLLPLDVRHYTMDSKLRHDLNFDGGLMFTPRAESLSGSKAEEYWTSLRTELEAYSMFIRSRSTWDASCTFGRFSELRDTQKRLPRTFEEIKRIMLILTPVEDHLLIREALDVGLIMQQIEHGVFDLTKLASLLSWLLKSRCVTRRDMAVNDMVTKLERGDQESNVETVVDGLEALFAILQAMKLDVANYQMMHIVPHLLDTSPQSTRASLQHHLWPGSIHSSQVLSWYASGPIKTDLSTCTTIDPHLDDFVHHILSGLMSFSASDPFPMTFLFDFERLAHIHADIVVLVTDEIYRSLLENYPDSEEHSSTIIAHMTAFIHESVSERLFGDKTTAHTTATNMAHALDQVVTAANGIYKSTSGEEITLPPSPKEPAPSLSMATIPNLHLETEFDDTARAPEKQNFVTLFSALESTLGTIISPGFTSRVSSVEAKIRDRVMHLTATHAHMTPLQLYRALVQRPLDERHDDDNDADADDDNVDKDDAGYVFTNSNDYDDHARDDDSNARDDNANSQEAASDTSDSSLSPNPPRSGSPHRRAIYLQQQSLHLEQICRRITHVALLHWQTWGSLTFNHLHPLTCAGAVTSGALVEARLEPHLLGAVAFAFAGMRLG